MAARALWKGRLIVGKLEAAVNLFTAVQERKVHFHLLHAKDLTPVQQRIVRKSDGQEVPKGEQLKAFSVSKESGVIVRTEELEKIQPKESRDIDVMRFVPRLIVGDEWYDRPYFLGPDKDDKSYFAIVDALALRNGLRRSTGARRRAGADCRSLDATVGAGRGNSRNGSRSPGGFAVRGRAARAHSADRRQQPAYRLA